MLSKFSHKHINQLRTGGKKSRQRTIIPSYWKRKITLQEQNNITIQKNSWKLVQNL